MVGAVPIFVDVDKDTFNISCDSLKIMIERTIEKGELIPRVILAVDLFGQAADYEELRKIASEYHLLILEDGAQGFGGKIGTQLNCSFGDIYSESDYPVTNMLCECILELPIDPYLTEENIRFISKII